MWTRQGKGRENRYWGNAKGKLKRGADQTEIVLLLIAVGGGGWSDREWGWRWTYDTDGLWVKKNLRYQTGICDSSL